jgi:hypothetical protein
MDFKSRAVRSLVELHERELPLFLDAWERFTAAGAPMPEALGDAAYQTREHLVAHPLRSARGYLTWIGECLGRPVTDVDPETDPLRLAARRRDFAAEVLKAWRRHLPLVTDAELSPTTYRTRWGEQYSIETMLEHAVVHPMRHRIQLERILQERAAGI